MLACYRPEPYVDFSQPGPREAMLAAIKSVGGQLGKRYPLWIGGSAADSPNVIRSIAPANPDCVVGEIAKATATQAEQAIVGAAERFRDWSRVPAEERAMVLAKAAEIMRRRVYELSAWMVYEVSKPWIEAYADVCEAIDFCDFYAREVIRLSGRHPTTPYPGEDNSVEYIPMGVVGVIPPWNFPLAICMGMTTAALVAGNTVVLKPSSDSAVIAAKMCEVLCEAGLPAGVLNFVPGGGGDVGETIVNHRLTRMIAFTGSREVGLRINERAAKLADGQIWIKRVILEMGGKDGILVDETADLDAAAEGVVAAAFGFQGQKCSACSRLVAVAAIYDKLLERVVERARRITVGDPASDENVNMGAVINEGAFKSISEYIKIGRGEGRAVLADGKVPGKGYFISPTIIADAAPNARIAQEEVFGPVLAVIKARDFEDGLAIINGTQYGLTGALFSRDRMRLHRARSEFHVGNLYLNRKCTGALVDVQPFGGFNMSGTNSKAGGRDYVALFLQGKSIAERL
ncbi:MAG: L-glutamate gamma-semialdehyde dehydrogenase [Phycisphaerales bacterium]|nr:L-glutamate gamma-semialdehyde dehydrogenase [Phycisphaerales bacterium]